MPMGYSPCPPLPTDPCSVHPYVPSLMLVELRALAHIVTAMKSHSVEKWLFDNAAIFSRGKRAELRAARGNEHGG